MKNVNEEKLNALLGKMVGDLGSAVNSIAHASKTAKELGLSNITFEVGD